MKKQVVVIINGSGGVGKDTFCDYVKKIVPTDVFSTVSRVKLAVQVLIGRKVEKDEKFRRFLSDIKLAWTRYNDGPTKYILNKVKNSKKQIIFLHIREPEEIDKTKNSLINLGYNCITLLITNKNVKSIKSNMADANVENYNYDDIITNDSNKYMLKIKAFILNSSHLRF